MMCRKLMVFLLFLSLHNQIFSASREIPTPEAGVLDLRHFSMLDGRLISLNGTWVFYWNRLVPADSLSSVLIPSGGNLVKVPSYWTAFRDQNGIRYSDKGFGTYFLRILLPPGMNDTIGFSLPVFDSAFDFFLNGSYMGSNGKVGTAATSGKPDYAPFTVYLKPLSDTLNVTIHVSNYRHRRGGFWKEMLFGKGSAVQRGKEIELMIVNISLGVLLAYFLFFLFFYFFYPSSKKLLFFAFTLCGTFIRLAATGSYPFQHLYHPPWIWLIRFEYLGTFMAFCAGLWYLHSIYPSKFSRLFNQINTGITAVTTGLIIFSRVRIFAWTMVYLEPVAVFMLTWYFVVSLKNLGKRGSGHALYFAALLLFILALLNDILLANSWSPMSGKYILHFSVLFFISVQAIMIIREWVWVFVRNEELLEEIEYVNDNLGNLVDQRTMEIEAQNKHIAKQNKELQNEVDFKNRVLSIIAHDLRDPLASINAFLEMAGSGLDLTRRSEIMKSASAIARSASTLVDNLLYWGRSQGKQLSLHPANCDMNVIVRDTFMLLGETAAQKGVKLLLEAETKTNLTCDREILMIILRNLISNAIKFSNKGEEVKVSLDFEEEWFRIIVEDQGVGMTHEQVQKIFSETAAVSTYGTGNEKGTGLGLRLCIDLVSLHQGKLDISSQPGEGSVITIRLPKNLEKAEK